MHKIRLSATLFILFLSIKVTAQDIQFSQFYAAPLYLNPAFAGSTLQARAGLNYRNQWPAINANFITYSAFFDYHFEDYNSGIGLLLSQDSEGMAGLSSTSASAIYSYLLYLTDKIAFKPGFQAGYTYRSINFTRLTFGDQFDPVTGELVSPSSGEQFNTGFSKGFLDLSTGGVLFTKTLWLGVGYHHLTKPQQSLLSENDRLPRKLSIHGGIKFYLDDASRSDYSTAPERSLTPTFQFKHQGPFDQLDLGLYYTMEPIIFGVWYRGVPFKNIAGHINNESLVFLIGMTKKGADDELNIGYSYDFTISGLGASSGGAHEFSLSYSWPMRDPRKPPRDVMFIPCPRF
ncbi:MAG: type IX secretion system membrane protein PorP/SprF [Cyclobacteriaceae bacterium]|nr:type IX secretion system membrane protein PorP/SprF [Cyclobacteriaceae bacterium]